MSSGQENEEFWRDFLSHPDTLMRRGRHILKRLPADPRCRLCAGPFTGVGGAAMRLIGKRQSQANPNYCNSCESMLLKHHGGAEVPGSFLFADIRGSTALAENIDARRVSTVARSLLLRRVGCGLQQ